MGDWNLSTWWWVISGVLVAAELATGTFYLLMLAIGTVAGALTAHAGLALDMQLVAAAAVGAAATVSWHLARSRRPPSAPASANPDVNLDIGARVEVRSWSADGSTHVQYRGARWHARFGGQGHPAPGPHVIRAVEGSSLLLDRA
jgi:membrane protein implicated in regulation of membrane protease activity